MREFDILRFVIANICLANFVNVVGLLQFDEVLDVDRRRQSAVFVHFVPIFDLNFQVVLQPIDLVLRLRLVDRHGIHLEPVRFVWQQV